MFSIITIVPRLLGGLCNIFIMKLKLIFPKKVSFITFCITLIFNHESESKTINYVYFCKLNQAQSLI